MRGLKDKVVVIAGGGAIGTATVERLAQAGARIVLGDLDGAHAAGWSPGAARAQVPSLSELYPSESGAVLPPQLCSTDAATWALPVLTNAVVGTPTALHARSAVCWRMSTPSLRTDKESFGARSRQRTSQRWTNHATGGWSPHNVIPVSTRILGRSLWSGPSARGWRAWLCVGSALGDCIETAAAYRAAVSGSRSWVAVAVARGIGEVSGLVRGSPIADYGLINCAAGWRA